MLTKRTTRSRGDDSYARGEAAGGNRSSLVRVSALDSEFQSEQPNPSPKAWKPVWFTGWHTGVVACATSVVAVLLINIGFTIYAAINPEYKMERGVGTLYSGSCKKSKTIGQVLHLVINALSTVLLAGSNYTQQCLSAPTRTEIDVAHSKRRWMDIGVPSIRNLFSIKLERVFLWIAIGATSVPLHLLYNSAVYTALAGNEFFVAAVTNNHFEPGAYTDTSSVNSSVLDWISPNTTTVKEFGEIGDQTDSPSIQLFNTMLEGQNAGAEGYEDLTPSECTSFYNSDVVSGHRNLFLITNTTSNAKCNNTLLSVGVVNRTFAAPAFWMCSYYMNSLGRCDPNELTANVASGLPWLVNFGIGEAKEISKCKSEKVAEKCKVQFSLGIMIAVIFCNLVKACCMIATVVRSREPTLVTLGDAIDSFLRTPDPMTMGICFADRRFIEREWVHGLRAGPRQWKRKGAQRWWTSVSRTRWVTSNLFFTIAIIVVGVLLRLGLRNEGILWKTDIKSLWVRGFDEVNSFSLITIRFQNMTQAILLANLPQTIISFLYLTYNFLFTCMLSGHEWSLFGHEHRTLRVTSPSPGQRSTYWLQLPYTYAIPLMTLSALLHFTTTQSISPARVEMSDAFGRETSVTNTVGYSLIHIIFMLTMGILAMLTAAGIGCKQFAAEITTVGSSSAAISAACHAWGADLDGIEGKKVRWGDVEIVSNLRVRHLTFSSRDGVSRPGFGEVYSGTGREKG